MGVWIEIFDWCFDGEPEGVTPFMGVWIEIMKLADMRFCTPCHSLYGSVD